MLCLSYYHGGDGCQIYSGDGGQRGWFRLSGCSSANAARLEESSAWSIIFCVYFASFFSLTFLFHFTSVVDLSTEVRDIGVLWLVKCLEIKLGLG